MKFATTPAILVHHNTTRATTARTTAYYRQKYTSDWEANMLRDTWRAAVLAVEARRRAVGAIGEVEASKVRVLGSLPPLCESHRPDLAVQFEESEGREFIVSTYRALAEKLVGGGVDGGFGCKPTQPRKKPCSMVH